MIPQQPHYHHLKWVEGLITNSMGEWSEQVDLKSFLLQMLRFNTSSSVADPGDWLGPPPPPLIFRPNLY